MVSGSSPASARLALRASQIVGRVAPSKGGHLTSENMLLYFFILMPLIKPFFF